MRLVASPHPHCLIFLMGHPGHIFKGFQVMEHIGDGKIRGALGAEVVDSLHGKFFRVFGI